MFNKQNHVHNQKTPVKQEENTYLILFQRIWNKKPENNNL